MRRSLRSICGGLGVANSLRMVADEAFVGFGVLFTYTTQRVFHAEALNMNEATGLRDRVAL